MRRTRFAMIALAILLSAPEAGAITIGQGCDPLDCYGLIVDLSTTANADGTTTIAYSIDTSAFDPLSLFPESMAFVSAVNWKVSADVDPTLVSLLSSPDPGDNWLVGEGQISSSSVFGCPSPDAGNGFICTTAAMLGDFVKVDGSVLTWEWSAAAGAFTNPFNTLAGEAHAGIKLNNRAGNLEGWIYSEVAPIPEPNAESLFLPGLLLVALALRMRVFSDPRVEA